MSLYKIYGLNFEPVLIDRISPLQFIFHGTIEKTCNVGRYYITYLYYYEYYDAQSLGILLINTVFL
jgi:hypothetical protein